MDKEFKPHMMYKDCKEVMAETIKKHLSLKKKGYNHKKSKNCEEEWLKRKQKEVILVGLVTRLKARRNLQAEKKIKMVNLKWLTIA